MTVLSRLYDFAADKLAGTPRRAAKVNAELNQIVNLLNGTSTDRRIYIRVNDSLPPVRLSQLGAGPILEILKSSAARVAVANSGQLQSSIATGTAPFSITSETVCPNLNANLISGVDPLTAWILQQVANQQVKGSIILNPVATGDSLKIHQESNVFTIEKNTGGSDILTIEDQNSATRKVAFPSTTQFTAAYTAAADNDVARWQELQPTRQGRITNGFILIVAVNSIFSTFIVPSRFGYKANEMIASYNTSIPTGTSTYTLQKLNGDGTTTDIQSVSLLVGTAVNTPVSTTFSDTTLADNEHYRIICTADNNHNGVTVQLNGKR